MWPVRLGGSLVREKADRCCSQSLQSRFEGIEGHRVNDVLRKTVPSIDHSLGEEVPSGLQTISILGNLDCVSSCECDIAEREHAVKAYSGPPFVHSEH